MAERKRKADWTEIANEYISGNISYRELAEKHGIGIGTLQQQARKDQWHRKRAEFRENLQKKALQRTEDVLAEAEANRMVRLSNITDEMLDYLEEAVGQLRKRTITQRAKKRDIEYEQSGAGVGKVKKETVGETENVTTVEIDCVDISALKQLTSAAKDIRDIQFATKAAEDSQDKPTITINVRAATPADVEEE